MNQPPLLPLPRSRRPRRGGAAWTRWYGVTTSCDDCTLETHEGVQHQHPPSVAHWRLDDGQRVLFFCTPHSRKRGNRKV